MWNDLILYIFYITWLISGLRVFQKQGCWKWSADAGTKLGKNQIQHSLGEDKRWHDWRMAHELFKHKEKLNSMKISRKVKQRSEFWRILITTSGLLRNTQSETSASFPRRLTGSSALQKKKNEPNKLRVHTKHNREYVSQIRGIRKNHDKFLPNAFYL